MTHLSIRGVVRSEATKLWSLRSPRWICVAMLLAPTILGMARAAVTVPAWESTTLIGTASALESVAIGALPTGFLAAVLGLISMGSEYTDDALSGTLTTVPRRGLLLVAKVFPVFTLSFVASVIGLGGAGILSALILAARGYNELSTGSVIGIVLAGAAGASLISILGLAVAAVTRSLVAGAIHLAGILALAPSAIGLALGKDAQWATDLLPATALQAIVTRGPARPFTIEGAPPSTFSWWGGIVVLVVWAAFYLAFALYRITRRVPQSNASGRLHVRRARTRKAGAPSGLSAVNILRAEALKVTSLPATAWLLSITAGVIVALALIRASSVHPTDLLTGTVLADDLALATTAHQAQTIAGGIGLAQVLLAFLGAVAVTSDFSTDNIRPTLIAAPRRSLVLMSKTFVVAVATFGVALTAHAAAALVATPIERRNGFDVSVIAPIVTETVLRCTLACVLVAITGCAIGVMLKTPVASIAALVAIYVLSHTALGPLQILTRGTPLVWLANLDEIFPNAVIAVQTVPANSEWPLFLEGDVLQLDPNQEMFVIAARAAIGTLVSVFVFRRRGI